jgi:putative transcriptional regulator
MRIGATKLGTAKGGPGYLDGQLLVAMPTMQDERFARAVIYVCAHSSEGAMGIVINQPAQNIRFPDLLVQLDVIPSSELIQLPTRPMHGAQGRTGRARARLRAAQRGFFHRELDAADRGGHLPHGHARHSQGDRARQGAGQCGARARLCRLGAGQLERDQANGWLNCDADSELLFGPNTADKYNQAMRKIGIDPGKLASDSGHA